MDRKDRPTIHYTQLPDPEPGSKLAQEDSVYKREVGRLLAEGHEGRWVLIKGPDIIGIYETRDEARTEAVRRFGVAASLTQQILTNEPVYFVRRHA
jgi:hypothetical protein